MIRLLILILVIGLLALFQTLGFSIFGVKPNLALTAVVAASFFVVNIWEGLVLILLAALFLKFNAVFNLDILVFCLIGTAALIVKKYLVWQPLINCLILIGLASLGLYLFLSPSLIISGIFLQEIIYNIILGIPVFVLLRWLKKIYF